MGTARLSARSCRGRLFDIKRFAVHDGPGLRTTLFLKGCPLQCIWCHNPEGMSRRPELVLSHALCIGCGACARACPEDAHEFTRQGEHFYHREQCTHCGACVGSCYAGALALLGRETTVSEVMAEVRKDALFYLCSGGGVTLSGGEPLLQGRFARALLKACKQEGFHTALDTCGHIPWPVLRASLPYADLVLYDLKHPDSGQHQRYTGVPNDTVLGNLRRLAEHAHPVEVRLLVLPTINDAPEAIDATIALLVPLGNITGVRLLAYHRLAGSKYARLGRNSTLPEIPPPGADALAQIAARIAARGLPVLTSEQIGSVGVPAEAQGRCRGAPKAGGETGSHGRERDG